MTPSRFVPNSVNHIPASDSQFQNHHSELCCDHAGAVSGATRIGSETETLLERAKGRSGRGKSSSLPVSSNLYFKTAEERSRETVEGGNWSVLKILDIRCWLS
jgi:hypothetical protein